MPENIREQIDAYYEWLKKNTDIRKVDHEWYTISTPFIDRHNDFIEIYVKYEDDKYFITDDGSTIDNLEASGCAVNSGRRLTILKNTVNGFGVKLKSNALEIESTKLNFPQAKHCLIQAILAINDMFYLSSPRTVIKLNLCCGADGMKS